MEKLYALSTRTEDPPDLIVLDTPPATNAVEFLEAPSRMLNALDNDATRWFLEPYAARGGKVANRLIDAGSSFFVKTIGRFTGTEAIQELAELLTYFQGMFEGFRQRAQAVETIMTMTILRMTILLMTTVAPRAASHRMPANPKVLVVRTITTINS